MHVALNWLFMQPRAGGVGTAARETVPRMLEAEPGLRLTIFAGAEADPIRAAAPWRDEVRWVRSPVTVTHGPPGNMIRTMGAQWVTQPLRAWREGAQVLHGMANCGALVAPGAALVTTVHDLIWMAYPQAMRARDRFGTRWTVVPSARAADRVLTDSAAGKQVLVERLGLDPDRIIVVPLGVSEPTGTAPAAEADVRERFGLGDAPVVLCVAQKRPHKNLAALVRALPELERQGAVVVIPGASTEHEAELRALAEELGVGERLLMPSWVEAADLEGLYRLAACVALPSFEEGFGLPVLEAMARGVPVACSSVSALGETAGDAASLFDPSDPGSIARAVGELLDDPALRAARIAAGRARASTFTWERTARDTLDAYRAAIEDSALLTWDRRS